MVKLKDSTQWLGCAFVALFVFASLSLNAETRVLQVTPNGCESTVSVVGADGCDAGQCEGDSACICASKGDHVEWQSPRGFKVSFQDDSPLKENCGKHFRNSSLKCVVKEDVLPGQAFDYEVIFEMCDSGTDPRIVIK